ncbi:copper amine oxidase N-terminal domain-containing protein [Lutibacter sp. B2]|nr:copper amine oxidase N-terminal domain-containing protein [Lutibacter sp. B2]
MKKKLSLLLVLSMMLTLVPMNVFATSSNRVVTTHKVDNEATFTAELKIKEEDPNEFAKDSEFSFVMTLDNAEFLDANDADTTPTVTDSVYVAGDALSVSTIRVNRVSDTEAEVTYKRAAYATNTEATLNLSLPVKVKDNGEVKVKIDADGTPISSGEYTIATASKGGTITTIADTVDFMDDEAIKTIKIEETSVAALKVGDKVKVRLQDSDFNWKAGSVTVEYAGGFTTDTQTVTLASDSRDFEFEVDRASTSSRGRIYIKGLVVTCDDDDKYGEVKVKISGSNVSDETIVVGERVDYGVSFKADADDDMAELFAGRYETGLSIANPETSFTTDEGTTEDDYELVTLKIKENVENAWLDAPRKAEIEFPSWVKVIGVDLDTDSKLSFEIDDKKDRNVVEVTRNASGKIDEDVTFYVSSKADEKGDVEVKISGRALPNETKVVLGKVLAPVEMKTEPTNLKLGVQDQEIGKITLTETKAEAFKEDKVVLALDSDFEWNDTPKVKVVKGDIEIDEDSIDTSDNELTFKIKGESTEASVIEITGGTVDLKRYLPEGDYEVKLKGAALVQNDTNVVNSNDDELDGTFDKDRVAKVLIARVITPADANTKAGVEVKMQLGNTEMQVGENVVALDVAPYADVNNRTMLPLRALLNALGVEDQNIMWNQADTSVTVFKGDRVIKVKVGEAQYTVNGVAVPMDTVAVNKDGRVMLPVRAMAQAVGTQVEWDAATRTVTLK